MLSNSKRSARPATPLASLIDAARLQILVIGALMLREIHTRYGRENLGFLWLIAEPFMFCMGVIIIWMGIHGRYEHGVPILAFVMTGYLPITLWRHVTNRSIHCFRANASLLYHRQIRMLDMMLARVILEIYGCAIAYLLIAFVFWAAGLYEFPKDWGLFYLGWLYFIAFSTGLGLCIGSLTEIYEWGEKLVGPFMYFLLPICGCFFMVEWLPSRVQKWALYVPTVNAYELIRGGQFGPSVQVHYDLAYENFICLLLLTVGLILTRQVHKHLVIE
jgi:capsular polysaccharide transport system permease protein